MNKMEFSPTDSGFNTLLTHVKKSCNIFVSQIFLLEKKIYWTGRANNALHAGQPWADRLPKQTKSGTKHHEANQRTRRANVAEAKLYQT